MWARCRPWPAKGPRSHSPKTLSRHPPRLPTRRTRAPRVRDSRTDAALPTPHSSPALGSGSSLPPHVRSQLMRAASRFERAGSRPPHSRITTHPLERRPPPPRPARPHRRRWHRAWWRRVWLPAGRPPPPPRPRAATPQAPATSASSTPPVRLAVAELPAALPASPSHSLSGPRAGTAC